MYRPRATTCRGGGQGDLDRGVEVVATMSHRGQNDQLRGGSRVPHDRHAFGADDYRREDGATADADRLGSPTRHRALRRDHEHDALALEPRPKARDVNGPGEALPVVGAELYLNDDGEDRLAIDQQDDEIGAILSWNDVR